MLQQYINNICLRISLYIVNVILVICHIDEIIKATLILMDEDPLLSEITN